MNSSNKYTFKFTPVAKQSIWDILDYITNNLANQKAANELYEEIEKAIERACLFPYAASVFAEEFRRVPINNYELFYYVKENEKEIVFVKMIYAKRNIKTEMLNN